VVIQLVYLFDNAFGDQVDMTNFDLIIKIICGIIKARDVYLPSSMSKKSNPRTLSDLVGS
jgi:hypothetical protein